MLSIVTLVKTEISLSEQIQIKLSIFNTLPFLIKKVVASMLAAAKGKAVGKKSYLKYNFQHFQ